MNPVIRMRSLAAVGIIFATIGGYAIINPSAIHHAVASTISTPSTADGTHPIASVLLPDFSAIVEQNGPAVVNVSVTEKAEKAEFMPEIPQLDPHDPFYQFFRQFSPPASPDETPTHGVGSGFIVSPDGIIITNAHVVAGASEVTVKLTDKREFNAKIVGIDTPTDIAVLKINANNLPTVKFGNSSDLKVGQWVLAIGSPYGFENSVTAGIVSAKYRSLPGGSYVPFIQTDVAVNPGNSGGPLFNMNGEVVGVNAQIYSTSGGYQGLSFAIPIDSAQTVERELLKSGHVNHARIGVTIQEVNQELAKSFGLDKPMGALVSSVAEDSPAARAGLKPGDIILKLDGKTVASSSELPSMVGDMQPGTTANLEILHEGVHKSVGITLGEMSSTNVASDDTDQPHGRLGLVVRGLTPEEKQSLDVSHGVVVEDATGPAAKAGIEQGDVILALDGTPIKNAEELRAVAAKAGNEAALLVQRNSTRIFIPIKLS